MAQMSKKIHVVQPHGMHTAVSISIPARGPVTVADITEGIMQALGVYPQAIMMEGESIVLPRDVHSTQELPFAREDDILITMPPFEEAAYRRRLDRMFAGSEAASSARIAAGRARLAALREEAGTSAGGRRRASSAWLDHVRSTYARHKSAGMTYGEAMRLASQTWRA